MCALTSNRPATFDILVPMVFVWAKGGFPGGSFPGDRRQEIFFGYLDIEFDDE